MIAVIVFSFIAAASAGVLPGYNYNQPGFDYVAPSTFGGSVSASGSIAQNVYRPVQPAVNEVTKNIYLYQGVDNNEGLDDDYTGGLSTHTNYNILFVKAPSQNTGSLARTLSRLQQNDKTVVYVLNKKTDVSDLKSAIDQVAVQPSKPEVFFIKYRTPAEAEHAQHEIQHQYDRLGGSTNVIDAGTSAVTSVIGSVGGTGVGTSATVSRPSSGYLPAYAN